MIPRATPGGPKLANSAGHWNALRNAALDNQTRGFREGQGHPSGMPFRCLNLTGQTVPKGGVFGISLTQQLIDFDGPTVESRYLAQPGCVGVIPQITTSGDPSETDHRLDWCIALRTMAPNIVAPVCVMGTAWVKVDVRDENHLFVSPVHDQHEYAATCSGGLARIIQLAPPAAADSNGKRWALVRLDPCAPVRLEGYLTEDLDAPTAATTTTVIATDATITSGSTSLTSAAGGFSDDLDEPGISIEVVGAGPAGTTLITGGEFVDANTITLDTAAATSVTTAFVRRRRDAFQPSYATLRIHEQRGELWYRTSEFVRLKNVDHSLSLAAGSFVRTESWQRDGWRGYWTSCNPASSSLTSRHSVLEDA